MKTDWIRLSPSQSPLFMLLFWMKITDANRRNDFGPNLSESRAARWKLFVWDRRSFLELSKSLKQFSNFLLTNLALPAHRLGRTLEQSRTQSFDKCNQIAWKITERIFLFVSPRVFLRTFKEHLVNKLLNIWSNCRNLWIADVDLTEWNNQMCVARWKQIEFMAHISVSERQKAHTLKLRTVCCATAASSSSLHFSIAPIVPCIRPTLAQK